MLSHQNSTASDAGPSRQRSQTPEPTGPPFEQLDYPLSDLKYNDMLKQMPPNHELLDEISKHSDPEDGDSAAGTSVLKKVRRFNKSWEQPVVRINNCVSVDDGTSRALGSCVVVEDSDTDSVESPLPEDPNDPEWVRSS